MGWISFIFLFGLIIYSLKELKFFTHTKIKFPVLVVLFSIKFIGGLALLGIYSLPKVDRNYADVYKYFDDAKTIQAQAFTSPKLYLKFLTNYHFDIHAPENSNFLENTNHVFKQVGCGFFDSNHLFLIRVHTLLLWISGGNIFVHLLFFSGLSFLGLMMLYKAFEQDFTDRKSLLLVVLISTPSVLFWGSGLLKESLLIFFVGIAVRCAFSLFNSSNLFLNTIALVISICFLWILKPFIALALMISFYSCLCFHFKNHLRIIAILLALFCVLISLLFQEQYVTKFLYKLIEKRNEFSTLALTTHANSLFDSTIYPETIQSFFKLIIPALIDGFSRPYIWQSFSKPLELLFAIENCLVFLVIFYCILNIDLKKVKEHKTLLIFCFAFSVMLYFVIGITVPVIGALVRYRIIGLLFFIIPFVLIIKLEKFIYINNYLNKLFFR